MITESVYLGRNNTNDVAFKLDDVILSFVVTTRVVLELLSSPSVIVDTDITPALIDYTTQDAAGIMTFDFGGLAVTPGTYRCRINVYDGTHPLGQTIVHESDPLVKFAFLQG